MDRTKKLSRNLGIFFCRFLANFVPSFLPYLSFLQILLPDVPGQGTLMKQHGIAAPAQTFFGYLKVIVMGMMTALATSYVELITVLIHSHLLLTAAMTL